MATLVKTGVEWMLSNVESPYVSPFSWLWLLRFYTNDFTPDYETELGDLTPATFYGSDAAGTFRYKPSFGSWTDDVFSFEATDPSSDIPYTAVYTASDDDPTQTVYGWYVVTRTSAAGPGGAHNLIAAGRLPTPRDMTFNGATITLASLLFLAQPIPS